MLENKVVLIVGGTGSIGNGLLKELLRTNVREVRVFSRDEEKQDEMRHRYTDDRVKFYIGNVRDIQSLHHAMYGVDYCIHAAALKQIPTCEFFPLEAVKTNIFGTENVLTACISNHIKKVICLSSDKAAYPVNAMGTSKAMMEKVFIAKSRTVSCDKTVISGIRCGDILCSRGSVIPLFIEQIKSGEPITVTDPEMTRFIISQSAAIQLILYVLEHGKTGEIYVNKAPACRIGTLARAVKDIFNDENQIKIIGIRHGEKMYETLLTNEECANAEDLGDYYKILPDKRDLNYDKYYTQGDKNRKPLMEYNSNGTKLLTAEQVKSKLLEEPYIAEAAKDWGRYN